MSEKIFAVPAQWQRRAYVNEAQYRDVYARSIDDPAVLKELAEQAGLNTENFDAILADPTFDAQVSADVELAHEYGLDAVPALVFADRYLVMGAQPYEMLKQVVEKVQEDA